MALLLAMGAASVKPSSLVTASSNGGSSAAGKSGQRASLKPAASTNSNIPFGDYDPQAEQVLLNLANQARAKAGLISLTPDAGLTQAARAHAQAMVAAHQLSHQFQGELPLPERLAAASQVLLENEGENVAFDFDADNGHRHLMQSPPHRANLLNASYNVVGLGVIRSGDRLYIVQDFGHAVPNYSTEEVKERVAGTVTQTRHHARLPDLVRHDLATVDTAACSMAKADRVVTAAVHQLAQHYTVLTYTSLHPETLPANADHAITGRNLRGFSVGACYRRTDTYPTGAYWVLLALE
jgi:uncharacterized protein YkwD